MQEVSAFQRYYEAMETLYSRGQRSITFRAIAKIVTGITRPDNHWVSDVKAKAGALMRRWELDRGQRPIPCRKDFFDRVSRPPYVRVAGRRTVATPDEARSYLAVGSAPAVGFYIPEGPDDPFELAWLDILSARSNGSVETVHGRIVADLEGGRLTDDGAVSVTRIPELPDPIKEAQLQRALAAASEPRGELGE